MSTLKGFLNPKKIENVKVVISDRFIDEETGKPIPFEIRPIGGAENDSITEQCMIKVPVPGRRGQTRSELDVRKYNAMLVTKSVVVPDFNEADIQERFGAVSAEQVPGRMLTSGEYATLLEKITEINGFDNTFDDLKEEAKN